MQQLEHPELKVPPLTFTIVLVLVMGTVRPVLMQYFRLMLVHREPVKVLALSVMVFLGAPINLITSSYASGAWLSLLMRCTFTNFVFLKAKS